MTVAFETRFDWPFFTGTPTAAPSVPGLWEVAIGGHAYLLDTQRADLFRHETIPHMRPTSFTDVELGERALNPDAGWRVSQTSWHKGAGQVHLDLPTADRDRFYASKGIDPWTAWQAQLLQDTTLIRASANTNLQAISVGTYVYLSDGNEVYWTTNMSTFTAATINIAEGSQRVLSITTDGFNVYAALAVNGVHVTTRGATTATHWNNLLPTLVAWCKGRLFAAKGPAIYLIPTAPGSAATAPTAAFTHDNTDWVWVDFTEGSSNIYAAGWSGDRSEIYRVTIKSDGSGLGAWVIAGLLPAGEVAYSLSTYLGFILIGTSLGIRIGTPDSAGDLQIGPLIPTGNPVRCAEGQDRFVWFGWENYDQSSSGLGRLDLTTFNDIAPAYASDLMGPSGQVTSVGTFGGEKFFTVNGVGLYSEAETPVASGNLDTGFVTYDIAEPKEAVALNVRHAPPFHGTHTVYLSADDDAFFSLGNVVFNGNVPAQETRAEQFGVRHVLGSDGTNSPILRRWTLVAMPAPRSAEKIVVPVQLWATNQALSGQAEGMDVQAEFEYLTGLRDSREVVTFQELSKTYTVTVTDYQWLPSTQPTRKGNFFQGTLVMNLTTVDSE